MLRREKFLDGFGQELRKSLSDSEVEALVSEARNHLEDSIQARLELGASLAEAEAQALAAFGEAHQVREEVRRREPSASVASRLYVMGTGYLVAALFILISYRLYDRFPNAGLWFFQLLVIVALGFAGCSFRARRPAPIPILATGVGGTFALWILLGSTWLTLGPYGGMGVVPPGYADRQVEESTRILAQRTADRAVFETAITVLRSPFGIEGLRSGAGYTAPVMKEWSYPDPLELTNLSDPKAARDAWERLSQNGRWRFETESLTSTIQAMRVARADSTWNSILHTAPSILPGGLAVAGVAALVDLGFGGLGAVVFQLRRRRPKGGLSA